MQDGALLKLDGSQGGYPDLTVFLKVKIVD
jgi:hypothetical protein